MCVPLEARITRKLWRGTDCAAWTPRAAAVVAAGAGAVVADIAVAAAAGAAACAGALHWVSLAFFCGFHVRSLADFGKKP